MNYYETECKLRELGITPDAIAWLAVGAQRFGTVSIRPDPDSKHSVTVSFKDGQFKITMERPE